MRGAGVAPEIIREIVRDDGTARGRRRQQRHLSLDWS
jgi:hypothetical protein